MKTYMQNKTEALAKLLEDAEYATRHVKPEFKSYYMAKYLIDENVVIKTRAHWMARIDDPNNLPRYQCSRCKHYVSAGDDRDYCPSCGAKMDT